MNYGISLYSINVIRFHQLTTSKGMTILAHSVNNTNYLFQITCSWNIINLLSLRTILFYLSVCLYTCVGVWVDMRVCVCVKIEVGSTLPSDVNERGWPQCKGMKRVLVSGYDRR